MAPSPKTPAPEWIADPVLQPLWERVRARLESSGLDVRVKVVVHAATREQRHAIGALLGRNITRNSVRIDLAQLDARLRERSGIGGLPSVLTALDGAPPRNRPAARAARHASRERPLQLAAELVDAPWVADWIVGLRRTGLLTHHEDAEHAVRQAATVLRQLTGPRPAAGAQSRVEVGATLFGDAHALDRDRPLHHIVLRGLAAAAGVPPPQGAADREQLWADFGVEPDLLSRTCLVWRLRGAGESPAVHRLNAAADAGDPFHLTEWDLRRIDSLECAETPVLVCENPRLVEALAERAVGGWAAVCTAGEPNLVVDKVLRRLCETGADLRYHGDFDWPGLAIAQRVITKYGAHPYRMTAADYMRAVRPDGPALTHDQLRGGSGECSWDPELAAAMRACGRAVHEESVLAGLFDEPDHGEENGRAPMASTPSEQVSS